MTDQSTIIADILADQAGGEAGIWIDLAVAVVGALRVDRAMRADENATARACWAVILETVPDARMPARHAREIAALLRDADEQIDALRAEVERLRTVDDAMVERARFAHSAAWPAHDRICMRAALEAALSDLAPSRPSEAQP